MKLEHLQPVWENSFIDKEKTTATLSVCEPIRREAVFTPDMPWEGDIHYINVLFDGEKYRMYYITHLTSKDYCAKYDYSDEEIAGNRWLICYKNSFVCYAESFDGINWVRPSLGIFEYKGSRENNIILRAEDIEGKYTTRDNFFVFKDENPACPEDERYKAVTFECGKLPDGVESSFREGISYYASADGIHFRFMRILNVIHGTFDTLNTCSYDKNSGKYVLYYRGWHNIPEGGPRIKGTRDVKRAESSDFVNWSDFTCISFADGRDDPMYTNNIMRYYRNQDILIGFPTRYVERGAWTSNYDMLTGRSARLKRMGEGHHPREGLAVTDCLFMCSKDGRSFERYNEAFMRPGMENGVNWVYGDCYPAYALLETLSDDGVNREMSMLMPNGATHCDPEANPYDTVYRYTLRRDGFAAYSAGYGGADVVTRKFTVGRGELFINFSTSAIGCIYVTLTASDGRVLRSAELFGDSDERRVIFDNGTLEELYGQEVVATFEMKDARLYSFGIM